MMLFITWKLRNPLGTVALGHTQKARSFVNICLFKGRNQFEFSISSCSINMRLFILPSFHFFTVFWFGNFDFKFQGFKLKVWNWGFECRQTKFFVSSVFRKFAFFFWKSFSQPPDSLDSIIWSNHLIPLIQSLDSITQPDQIWTSKDAFLQFFLGICHCRSTPSAVLWTRRFKSQTCMSQLLFANCFYSSLYLRQALTSLINRVCETMLLDSNS